MANYDELNGIITESVSGAQSLRENVFIACAIAASIIVSNDDTADPPWGTGGHTQRLKWVDKFIASPMSTAREVFGLVVAKNAALTQSQILNATDAGIQSAVNEMIDSLATGLP